MSEIVYNNYKEEKNILNRTLVVFKRDGIGQVSKYAFEMIKNLILPKRKFIFNDKQYKTLKSWKPVWRGEREVEVPISLDLLKEYSDKDVLEIGNTMKMYSKNIFWEIVDKYEKDEGVKNIDVVDYKSDKKFDLIFSISTLEHVGFEEGENPKKVETAIKNLVKHLKSDGILLYTCPFEFNPTLDDLVIKDKFNFVGKHLLLRKDNQWMQVKFEDYMKSPSDKDIILFTGIIKKHSTNSDGGNK